VQRLRHTKYDRSAARAAAAEIREPLTTVLWCIGALLLLGPAFVFHALRTNYTELYASYMRPPEVVAGWLLDHFGWAAWSLAAAGYVAAWRTQVLDRRRLAVVLAMLLVTLCLWTFRVRQLDAHYALHMVPLIALGRLARRQPRGASGKLCVDACRPRGHRPTSSRAYRRSVPVARSDPVRGALPVVAAAVG
jgi:hypothetical protein